METFHLEEDIRLWCIKADAFPEGIGAVHQKLKSMTESWKSPVYFGISYFYDDEILYMAGVKVTNTAETLPEAYISYTLPKGTYMSRYIRDYQKDVEQIGQTFEAFLSDTRLDENGCCAEWYFPEGKDGNHATDVRCMVPMAD